MRSTRGDVGVTQTAPVVERIEREVANVDVELAGQARATVDTVTESGTARCAVRGARTHARNDRLPGGPTERRTDLGAGISDYCVSATIVLFN